MTNRATLADLERATEQLTTALDVAGVAVALELVTVSGAFQLMIRDESGRLIDSPIGPAYLGSSKREALEQLTARTATVRDLITMTTT